MSNEQRNAPSAASNKPVESAPAPVVVAPVAYGHTIAEDGSIRTGNLTRDNIAMQIRGTLTAEGKSEADATKAAVKRAYEMVKG
jgi:hypothetical protein